MRHKYLLLVLALMGYTITCANAQSMIFHPGSPRSEPFQYKFKSGISGAEVTATATIVDGKIIAGNDMVLGNAADIGRGAAFELRPFGYWPNNEIPYEIERGHPDSADILKAIANINSTCCFRLVPIKAGFFDDYVIFEDDEAGSCWSMVGRQGLRQVINVNGCGVGAIMHEIMHAFGFIHEQERSDRGKFIEVDTKDIVDKLKSNFNVFEGVEVHSPTYDFASIMHYPATITDPKFLKTGTSTTVFKSKGTAAETALMGSGQANAKLSPLDISTAKFLCDFVKANPFVATGSMADASDSEPESIVPAGSQQATIKYFFPGSSDAADVTVDVVNGLAILDGDIVLGTMADLGGGRGGAAIAPTDHSANRRWPNNTMFFDDYAVSQHPCADTIRRAIQRLDAQTNLTLTAATRNDPNFITFVDGGGYSSPVGMQGGKQTITISSTDGCPVAGIVMHEMLHSSGVFHEQSRADRGTYVAIQAANVADAANKIHNFQTYLQRGMGGKDIGPYDYSSIMHYGKSAFGKPAAGGGRMQTIRSLQGAGKEALMGQRVGLSPGDINTVNTMYPSTTTGVDATGALDREYSVDLVPQGANYSNWDAAAAMVAAWLPPAAIVNPTHITNRYGYWSQFEFNIDIKKQADFFRQWGLEMLAPRTYTPRQLFTELQRSPLLVAPGNGAAHARVVYGMRGDGTPQGTVLFFHDPLDSPKQAFSAPNNGYSSQVTFEEFVNAMKRLAGTGGDDKLLVGRF